MMKNNAGIFLFLFVTIAVAVPTKIACIGNSITYGYGLSSPNTQSYPARLQALLGTTNYTVQNDGVNSTTMLKNGDDSYWKNGKLADVFAFQPKIITIKLGTNDSKPQNWGLHYQEFKGDYLAMVDTLAAMASKPKIYVLLPVPVFNNPTAASWGIRDSIIKLEIPIIKQVAQERGLTVIDCRTPLLNFPQYFSVDGVHPSAAGEDTLAQVIYRGLIATSAVPLLTNSVYRNSVVQHGAYPFFSGCSLTALFADVKPGFRYDLTIVNTAGAVLRTLTIDASVTSQRAIGKLMAATPAMSWAIVKKRIN
jgi:lysophospholipase L1-like esterase